MQPIVELLGHIVDKNGIQVADQKVEKVMHAIPPNTREEFLSFLGLASYFRCFIAGFAKIARPLNEKMSEKVEFRWSEDMQTVF